MRLLFLLVLAQITPLIAGYASPAHADRKPLQARGVFSELRYSTEDLVRVAFPELDDETARELLDKDWIDIAYWPSRPNTAIAAALTASDDSEGATLDIAILEKQGSKIVRRTAGKHAFKTMLWNSHIALDLAPYRLNDKTTAFGVRLFTSYSSTAHSSDWTEFYLYHVLGENITNIFDATVDSSTIQKEGSDDASDLPFSRDKSVIIVDTQRTQGNYDLILKTKKDTCANEGCDTRLTTEVVQTRYRWNGTRYVAGKEEAVNKGHGASRK